MGAAPNVFSCEEQCDADMRCSCFTFCPSPNVSGCPDGPSCWFYEGPTGGHDGLGFTAGCSSGSPTEVLPVWTAFENATPASSDTFAFYPMYPAESYGLVMQSEATRAIAQSSSRTYTPDWVHSGVRTPFQTSCLHWGVDYYEFAIFLNNAAPPGCLCCSNACDFWDYCPSFSYRILGKRYLGRTQCVS